jgi:hypothetical protein
VCVSVGGPLAQALRFPRPAHEHATALAHASRHPHPRAAPAAAPNFPTSSSRPQDRPEPFRPGAVNVSMYRALALACCAAACVSGTPSSHDIGDAGAKLYQDWPSAGPPGREPDLGQALFFARPPGGNVRMELKVGDFVAQVQTGAQATRTHLWITVANPHQFQVEAVMRLPIPPGAAVSRAVLHVGAEAVEGAFVGRDRARAIYRSITERRRDPALVTWSGPEWIEASVFPVEKADRRTLELEWIEPTASRDACLWYRVPVLAHEGKNVQRPSRITVDGVTVDLMGRGWLPLAKLGQVELAAVARVPGEPLAYAFAPAEARKAEKIRLVLVAETSQQIAPSERRRQRALIEELLTALPESAGVTLLAADWAIASVAESAPPSEVRAALDHLDGIPSAGALDLESALRVASDRARTASAHSIVFIGPGADAFRGDGLVVPLRQMQDAGQSLIVVGSEAQPIADAAALTGGESLPWTNTSHAVARVLALLERTPPSLHLADAEKFHALETVTGETRWLARFAGTAPTGLARADARELEALWARARVAATSGRDDDPGQRHHVLTPLTSILVLESTAEYGRYGIRAPEAEAHLAKKGLAQTRGLGALGLLAPAESLPEFPSSFGRGPAAGNDATESVLGALIGNQVGEAYGIGGMATVGTGTGTGGGGTGEGTIGLGNFGTIGKAGGGGNSWGYGRGGLVGRRAKAPEIIPGQATVRGALDREIIRRVVRMHMNEVRYCYETELARRPGLAGRVAVQFVIGATGEALSSVLQSSTLGNARVENCIVQAFRRWTFPKPPAGGIVIASYPINLLAGEGAVIPELAAHRAHPAAANEPWNLGLATLQGKGESKDRVAKIATMLGAPTTESAAVLAWWLVEHHLRSGAPILGACILAANLLREAGQPHEAGRVLSEAAAIDLATARAEFRRWASTQDLARLDELAGRR